MVLFVALLISAVVVAWVDGEGRLDLDAFDFLD
jgi:hypothetical protein